MDIKLNTLLSNGIIDPGKITEVLCEGTCIWKGLSEDVEQLSKDYTFINFDHSDRGCFNKPEYVINVSKNKSLVESKEVDMEYGVPEEKKFPLYDKEHVQSAIKFFNYVKPEYEENLAEAIKVKMKTYKISADHVGEKNRLSKYLTEEIKEWNNMSSDEQKNAKADGSLFYMDGILHVIGPDGYARPALSKDEKPKQQPEKGKKRSLREDDENTNILNNLRSDLQGELTAIKDYSSHADAAEEEGFKDVAKVLRDISKEEKVHCGELQAILDKHDAENKEAFEDGEKEAEETLEEAYLYEWNFGTVIDKIKGTVRRIKEKRAEKKFKRAATSIVRKTDNPDNSTSIDPTGKISAGIESLNSRQVKSGLKKAKKHNQKRLASDIDDIMQMAKGISAFSSDPDRLMSLLQQAEKDASENNKGKSSNENNPTNDSKDDSTTKNDSNKDPKDPPITESYGYIVKEAEEVLTEGFDKRDNSSVAALEEGLISNIKDKIAAFKSKRDAERYAKRANKNIEKSKNDIADAEEALKNKDEKKATKALTKSLHRTLTDIYVGKLKENKMQQRLEKAEQRKQQQEEKEKQKMLKKAAKPLLEEVDYNQYQILEEYDWNPNEYPIMNDGDGKGDYYLDGEEKIYKPKPAEEQEQKEILQESITNRILRIRNFL